MADTTTTTIVQQQESLNDVAARIFPGQDVTRFNELLALNPTITPFQAIPAGTVLNTPSPAQTLQYATPVLTSIGKALSGQSLTTSVVISDAQSLANAVANIPALQGYPQAAIAELAKVNNIVTSSNSAINAGQSNTRYNDPTVKLISWLLSNKV